MFPRNSGVCGDGQRDEIPTLGDQLVITPSQDGTSVKDANVRLCSGCSRSFFTACGLVSTSPPPPPHPPTLCRPGISCLCPGSSETLSRTENPQCVKTR